MAIVEVLRVDAEAQETETRIGIIFIFYSLNSEPADSVMIVSIRKRVCPSWVYAVSFTPFCRNMKELTGLALVNRLCATFQLLDACNYL